MLFISACSSTANNVNKSFYTNKFSVEKKSFSSDKALLFSLLNRPTPEDQQLMLNFTHTQGSLALQYPQVSYVSIHGDRKDDKSNDKQTYAYQNLIYQDQNSVAVGAPR
jgi:hypothetical protein